MILSAITGGLGLAQSIYGGIKASKEAKRQRKIIGQEALCFLKLNVF